MATSTADRAPRRDWLLPLALALVAGVVLRLWALDALSLYFDELYATRIHGFSPRNVVGVIARSAFYDQHPPLYYLLALAWSSLAGVSEWGVRTFSVACALATLPVVFLLGEELHSRRVGAWAAALVALHPLHVYYSREARMYALLTLLASSGVLLLARLARAPRRRDLALWMLTACALVLTHYFGVILVMAQAVVLALRGRRGLATAPSWLALFAVPAAVFAPFALFAGYQSKHFDGSYLEFSARAYLTVVEWLGGGHSRLPLVWILPFTALVVTGAVVGLRAESRRTDPDSFPGPPPATKAERLALFAVAAGALLAAVGFLLVRAKILTAITDLEMGRGESAEIAALQARTAANAVLVGALAVAVIAPLAAVRDRLSSLLASKSAAPEGAVVDPARSLVRLSLVILATPFVVTLIAGLLGRPLVLVRNFITTVPFLALLAALGLGALPSKLRPVAVALVAALALFVSAQFRAVPGAPGAGAGMRDWLLHVYFDWRQLGALVPPGDGLPLVVAQHYATDSAIHYRGSHDVVRVRVDAPGAPLLVGQVRGDGDLSRWPWREGQPFTTEGVAAFYWLDGGSALPGSESVGRALALAVRERHQCAELGPVTGGARVYRCVRR